MVWQPAQLTRGQMEERRLAAARLLRSGRLTQAQIAREVGVSRASVTRWRQCLAEAGRRGLRRRPPAGRPSRLSVAQWRQLGRILDRGARAAGFDTERWTLRRIAATVEQTFGVQDHFRSLGRASRAQGFSPQQPIARARERDDELVEAGLRRDWVRLKRGLAEQGAPLPSWTRRVTRFGPASGPPGRAAADRRS
jgi:transposase